MTLAHILPEWNDSESFHHQLSSSIRLEVPVHLDGGGSLMTDDFIRCVRKYGTKDKYKRGYEWCSGAGFIGFDLLGYDICENMIFSDYYSLAIENCLYNAGKNSLEHRVTGYVSETITAIPNLDLVDLVVGNPPHAFGSIEITMSEISKYESNQVLAANTLRILSDENYATHIDFFRNIHNLISDDADVFIYEPTYTRNLDEIIKSSKLKVVGEYPFINFFQNATKSAPWIDHEVHKKGCILHFKLK